MELEKHQSLTEDKLSFYTKRDTKISEKYELLGFKNELAMISPTEVAKESSSASIKDISQSSSQESSSSDTESIKNVKMVKLEVDNSGQKFINLNGKKLKVINQTQVPITNANGKQMVVKHKTINIGSASSPLKVRVISKVTQVGAPKLVRVQNVNNVTDKKMFEVINDKTLAGSVIPCSTKTNFEETSCEELDPFLCDLPKSYKLLSEKSLKVLHAGKMKALNLSLKDKIKQDKVYSEISVQTDPTNTRESSSQTGLDAILDLDFENWLDMNSKDLSPVLNNVNLGIGPSMGKFIVASNKSVKNCTQNSDFKSADLKKKILFFEDLRNALLPDASGNLLIHEGVLKQDKALVKRMCIVLRARNSDVNQENHDGCTPLQLAVVNDVHHDIIQTLLDYGAEIGDCDGDGNNIIHLAAKYERTAVLQVIFYHRLFETHYSQFLDSFNFEGLTPLMICCMAGWYEGVELFVENGSNVNYRDQKSGRTALFHAAEIHNEDIVRLLLDHGADAKIKNFFGTSPHDAMYELEDMPEEIKNLIFGKTKKRSIDAEMNPVRTAKAAKILKTYPKFKRIENRDGMIMLSTGIKAPQPQLPSISQPPPLSPLQPRHHLNLQPQISGM